MMAKTNWQMGDTVQPADLNQIGQEINKNTSDIANIQQEIEHLDLSADKVTLDSPNFTSKNVLGGLEELFQRGVDVKEGLVARLNAMNVSASTSETIDELLLKIMDISKDANAAVADLFSDKTFYQGGVKRSGTMVDRGNVNQTLTQQNQEYTIAAGKHGGTGKVRANIANLIPDNIKAGVSVGGVQGNVKEAYTKHAIFNQGAYNTFNTGARGAVKFGSSRSATYIKANGNIKRVYTVPYGDGGTAQSYIEERTPASTIISTIDFFRPVRAGSVLKENYFYSFIDNRSNTLGKFDYNGTLLTSYPNPSPSIDKTATISDIFYSDYYGKEIVLRERDDSTTVSGMYDITGNVLFLGTGFVSTTDFKMRELCFFSDSLAFLLQVDSASINPSIRLISRTGNTWTFNYASYISINTTSTIMNDMTSLARFLINILREWH